MGFSNRTYINKFVNNEVGPRSDGRYDTSFILNLSGMALSDSEKLELSYDTTYGYGGTKKFGAVVEVVDKIESYSHNPDADARKVVRFFKETAREVEGKEHVIRSYYLMLPSRGDPRFGFHLCTGFINSQGKVYVNLLDVLSRSSKPEPMKFNFAEFKNEKAGERSDGRFDTVFILNLTAIPLSKIRKGDLGYDAVHGYGGITKFGAVFEYVNDAARPFFFPVDAAKEMATTFLDASQQIVGKRYSSRTYKLMLPRDGDPRFGFCLCSEFINLKGELFIDLLE